MTTHLRFLLNRHLGYLIASALGIGAAASPTHAQIDTLITSTTHIQYDSAGKPPKPWQANLSLTATHGLFALGRDFGLHYWQASLQSIGYSSQDGLVFALGVGYARRFCQGNSPYVGFAFDLPWSEASHWHTALWVPALGYEFRQPNYYLHFEGFMGTPLDSDFTEAWGYGFGIGFGIPF